MKDVHKTKSELVEELNDLRQQVTELQGLAKAEASNNSPSLQSLVDALPAFVSYVDCNHYYKLVNKHYEKWLNKPKEKIIGQHFSAIFGDEGYAQAKPYLDKAFSGSPVSYEISLQEQDGTHVYNVQHAPDICLGIVQGVFVLVTDNTADSKSLTELAEKEKYLSRVQRVAQLVRVEWDLVNDCAELSGEHVHIFGVDSKYCTKNASTRFMSLVHPDDRKLVKQELDRAINDKTPVQYDYRIIRDDGSLCYIHNTFEVSCDKNGEVVKLSGMSQDVTKRKEIEDAVREQKDIAQGLIDTAPVIILVLDTEGHIVRFNPYMEEISGYTLDEVEGKDWFTTFVPVRHRGRIHELFKKAITNNRTDGNINPILTRHSGERIIQWYDRPLRDSDKNIIGLLATGQDITELVVAENQLREERNLLKYFFSATPDCVVYKDKDFIYRSVNPAFCKFLGKKESEIIGKTDYDLFPEDEARTYREYDALVIKTGEPFLRDELVSTPNGEKFWLQVAKTQVRDDRGGVLGVLVSVRDISERKFSELALIELEESIRQRNDELENINQHLEAEVSEHKRTFLTLQRFRSALDASLDAIYLIDPDEHRFIDSNKAGWELLGYTRDKLFSLGPGDIKPLVSRQELDQYFSEACDKGKEIVISTLHQRKDGSTFPVEVKIHSLLIEGDILIVAIARDITDKQKAELMINDSRATIRTLIDSPTDEYFMLFDLDNNLLELNEAAAKQLKGSVNNLRGKNLADLFHKEVVERRSKWGDLVKAIKEPMSFQDERNGRIFDIRVYPVIDNNDAVIRFTVFGRDITELKNEAAERLSREIAHRETLVREVHHRIKNNLQSVTGLLRRQARKYPENKLSINDAIGQVEAIASVFGLQGIGDNVDLIDLTEMIESIIQANISLFSESKSIKFNNNVKSNYIVQAGYAVPLALVFNELVTNAFKHSSVNYINHDVFNIEITLDLIEEHVCITITNPGKLREGLDFDKDCGIGTGLNLVKSLLPLEFSKFSLMSTDKEVVAQLKLSPTMLTSV
jgi:PAS domain S-box-containing protein